MMGPVSHSSLPGVLVYDVRAARAEAEGVQIRLLYHQRSSPYVRDSSSHTFDAVRAETNRDPELLDLILLEEMATPGYPMLVVLGEYDAQRLKEDVYIYVGPDALIQIEAISRLEPSDAPVLSDAVTEMIGELRVR